MTEKKLITKFNKFIFIFYLLFNFQKQWNCTSPAHPAHCTFLPYTPPSRTLIFGLLLCGKSLIGSCLRPRPHPSLYFFVVPFSRLKQWDNAPPCNPTRSCLLSSVPSIPAADIQLIAMSCCLTAVTRPCLPLFF